MNEHSVKIASNVMTSQNVSKSTEQAYADTQKEGPSGLKTAKILIAEVEVKNNNNSNETKQTQNDKQNTFNNHYLSVSQISINDGAKSGIN